MPIRIVCPTCAKQLQVGDQFAGRKVSCPGCKTVVTAPGSPPPPPPPKPAPPPPPPARAAAPVVPPPPPQEPEQDDFSFGSPRAKPAPAPADDEDDAPKPKPKKGVGIVGSIGGKKEKDADPKPRNRDDKGDEDDYDTRRKHGRSRSRSEPSKPAPSSAWAGFGSGSALAKWGLWVEFLALVVGLGIVGYLLMGLFGLDADMLKQIDSLGGPMMIAPFFIGSLVGTTLTLVGRTRMMDVPPGGGVKKVFFCAWAFTLIRFLTVLAAAVLIVLAGSQWEEIKAAVQRPDSEMPQGFMYFLLAFAAYGLGTPFLALADLSTIPAMAVVGGEISSEPLRRRASLVTFALQFLVLGYIFLAAVSGAVINQANFGLKPRDGDVIKSTAPTTPAKTGSGSASSAGDGAKAATALVLGMALVVQLAYTALYASLYAAGARAVAEAKETQEAIEDEDV